MTLIIPTLAYMLQTDFQNLENWFGSIKLYAYLKEGNVPAKIEPEKRYPFY